MAFALSRLGNVVDEPALSPWVSLIGKVLEHGGHAAGFLMEMMINRPAT